MALRNMTQEEIDRIMNTAVQDEQEDAQVMDDVDDVPGAKAPDLLTIHGEWREYPVELRIELPRGLSDYEYFMDGLDNYITSIGIKPPKPVTPARPEPNGKASTAASNGNGGGCPIHGTRYQRNNNYGPGYTCTGFADSPQPWSKDTPSAQGKYFCKSRWQ